MRFGIPARPSVRDMMIYREVQEGHSQTAVGQTWGVSQSQVSRIHRKVRAYILRAGVLRDAMPPDEAQYLANEDYLQDLQKAQRLCLEAFENGVHTQVTVEDSSSANGRGRVHKQAPGKANPRLIQEYVAISKELRDVKVDQSRLSKAVSGAYAGTVFEEEQVVTRGMEAVDEARALVKRLARNGYKAPELPRITRDEIVAHLRRSFRENRNIDAFLHLPPEWQELLPHLQMKPEGISVPDRSKRTHNAGAEIPNSKHQIPNKPEIPNTNDQKNTLTRSVSEDSGQRPEIRSLADASG